MGNQINQNETPTTRSTKVSIKQEDVESILKQQLERWSLEKKNYQNILDINASNINKWIFTVKAPNGTPYIANDTYKISVEIKENKHIKYPKYPPCCCFKKPYPFCCNVNNQNGNIIHPMLTPYLPVQITANQWDDAFRGYNPSWTVYELVNVLINYCFIKGGYDINLNGCVNHKATTLYKTNITKYCNNINNIYTESGIDFINNDDIIELYSPLQISLNQYKQRIKTIENISCHLFNIPKFVVFDILIKQYYGTEHMYCNLIIFLKSRNSIDPLCLKLLNGGPMELFIKTLTGKTLIIRCQCNDKIQDLKKLIFALEKIPENQQRLIFAGKQLYDEYTLSHYNISNRCTLCLVLRIQQTK